MEVVGCGDMCSLWKRGLLLYLDLSFIGFCSWWKKGQQISCPMNASHKNAPIPMTKSIPAVGSHRDAAIGVIRERWVVDWLSPSSMISLGTFPFQSSIFGHTLSSTKELFKVAPAPKVQGNTPRVKRSFNIFLHFAQLNKYNYNYNKHNHNYKNKNT